MRCFYRKLLEIADCIVTSSHHVPEYAYTVGSPDWASLFCSTNLHMKQANNFNGQHGQRIVDSFWSDEI